MHNLKELRKNLSDFKKKFENRNTDFNIDDFKKKDTFNRDLISKKENIINMLTPCGHFPSISSYLSSYSFWF